MTTLKAFAAASLLAASFGLAAGFPTPALSADSAADTGVCAKPYITKQVARGRAHWYLIRRGFERTAEGKPRVIMGKATCEAGFWRVEVTLLDYDPKRRRHETILINASSGKVIRNISIIS